ncbi:hypothetical protein Q5P01_011999 [Channa striata]|uniref:Uncharacterized protein n=1 Tax=Channa striata TaxID=64152 RepID=A0AA88MRK1_CHASR|nr:hypothetical protein Q5P01_011999 [Channa striata]
MESKLANGGERGWVTMGEMTTDGGAQSQPGYDTAFSGKDKMRRGSLGVEGEERGSVEQLTTAMTSKHNELQKLTRAIFQLLQGRHI